MIVRLGTCSINGMVILLLSIADLAFSRNTTGAYAVTTSSECFVVHSRAEVEPQDVYRVGVLAIRGIESAYQEFNKTFNEYLTATVGQRFEKPTRFELHPVKFANIFDDAEGRKVDFIYLNPSAYSCIESEFGAESLVSQISRRYVGGMTYELTTFGGVIFTRADRDDINTVDDLEGKIIATASISGLGSGQMQFKRMMDAGMSYLNDPKQLVFTFNQGKVVNGVLNGDFDVGFVRTDQLERSKDNEGNPLDLSLVKIVDVKMDNDPSFPFQSSTALYPEWNLAVLPHVDSRVAVEVQSAMLALAQHASCAPENEASCSHSRCDTSNSIATVAQEAINSGKFNGWRHSLSYMTLRSMQERTGFISFNPETNRWACVRSGSLYNSISCPEGYERKPQSVVDRACADAGLECAEGFDCLCQPCEKLVHCVDSIEIMGGCVAWGAFFTILLVPFIVVSLMLCLSILYFKSKQMLMQANQAAENEREVNEFIAHEVRNPLSAAISATTFVTSTVGQGEITDADRASLAEDLGVIDLSLRFMNDLLGSMLDLHRTKHSRLSVGEAKSICMREDVLEPVASMIYARDVNFQVIVDCPNNLLVATDGLRLKQIIMNLARNSARFVTEGFIRFRSEILDGNVRVIVEDSGPGIPKEKREHLFSLYQDRLDTIHQGRGVGLSLCQKLAELLKVELFLDESYVSGHKHFPGTRFVVNMKMAPIDEGWKAESGTFGDASNSLDIDLLGDTPQGRVLSQRMLQSIPESVQVVQESLLHASVHSLPPSREEGEEEEELEVLPTCMSVLIVDDDRILRKQMTRAFKRFRPDWIVKEAASGEASLKVVEENDFFHIIFMDQYMTSVEQSLTGTETTRILRKQGVESVICGLSANSLEEAFLKAGADHFRLKPFPCQQDPLLKLLCLLVAKRDITSTVRISQSTSDGEEETSPV